MTTKRVDFVVIILLITGILFEAYQVGLQTAPSVMVAQLISALNIEAAQVGFIAASFFYSYVILQIPIGTIADHFGPHRLLMISFLLLAIFCALFAFSQNFTQAITSRLFMGIVAAPAFICTLAIAAKHLPFKNFAFFVGITQFIVMLGGAFTGGVLSFMVESYGWRETMFLYALVGVFCSLLALFFSYKYRKSSPFNLSSEAQPKKAPLLKQLMVTLKNFQVWLCGLFAGCVYGIVITFGGLWAVPFFRQVYDTSLHRAGILSAMIFIGVAIGTLLVSWVSDRLEKRKIIMVIGTCLSLLLLIIAIYFPLPLFAMHFLLLLLGVCLSVYLLAYPLSKEHADPTTCTAAIGLTNTLCCLAAPILQPLIGYLLIQQSISSDNADTLLYTMQNYQVALLALPICLGIALLCLVFIKESIPSHDLLSKIDLKSHAV